MYLCHPLSRPVYPMRTQQKSYKRILGCLQKSSMQYSGTVGFHKNITIVEMSAKVGLSLGLRVCGVKTPRCSDNGR